MLYSFFNNRKMFLNSVTQDLLKTGFNTNPFLVKPVYNVRQCFALLHKGNFVLFLFKISGAFGNHEFIG